MSVPKSQRSESPFEVFHHAYELRRDMTDLLLRDFGYKVRDKPKQGDKPKTEAQLVQELAASQRRAAFHEWYIAEEREEVLSILRKLMADITMANSLYPASAQEYYERRRYQDEAIGCCYRLFQELQYIIDTLPVDVNRYMRFADSIQKEIVLLKGWRKSDNKYRKPLGIA